MIIYNIALTVALFILATTLYFVVDYFKDKILKINIRLRMLDERTELILKTLNDKVLAHKEKEAISNDVNALPFIPPRLDNVEWKIGDHVKFKTNGGWYNTGVIEDIDEDSCLVKIEWLGFESSSSLNAPNRVRLPLYKLMRR